MIQVGGFLDFFWFLFILCSVEEAEHSNNCFLHHEIYENTIPDNISFGLRESLVVSTSPYYLTLQMLLSFTLFY